MSPSLTLIVACTENRVIGRAGRLPFAIPEDKAWFLEKTAGTTVVLGRVGFEGWPQAMADGRQPIVVTSHPDRVARGRPVAPRTAPTVPAALALAHTLPGPILVCGGQRIYEETLPLADRLVLTLVHADLVGDKYFPEWRNLPWRETWRRDSRDANFSYTFLILEK